MTIYAEVQGATLIQYPYTFASLLAENPYTNYGANTDFVSIFPGTDTAIKNGYTLAPVTISVQPTYNPLTQICTQNTAPTLIGDVWTLGWTVTAMTTGQQTAAAAAAVQSLLAYNATALTNKRTAGITVSGIPVPADAVTVGEISGAYLGAQANASTPNWIFQWQLPNGSFEPLTATQILSVAPVVLAFVQTCNAAAAANATAITASPPTVTTTAQIDATYAALMTSF